MKMGAYNLYDYGESSIARDPSVGCEASHSLGTRERQSYVPTVCIGGWPGFRYVPSRVRKARVLFRRKPQEHPAFAGFDRVLEHLPARYQRSEARGLRLANLRFRFLCLNPLRLEAGDSSLLTTESPLTGGRGDSPSLIRALRAQQSITSNLRA